MSFRIEGDKGTEGNPYPSGSFWVSTFIESPYQYSFAISPGPSQFQTVGAVGLPPESSSPSFSFSQKKSSGLIPPLIESCRIRGYVLSEGTQVLDDEKTIYYQVPELTHKVQAQPGGSGYIGLSDGELDEAISRNLAWLSGSSSNDVSRFKLEKVKWPLNPWFWVVQVADKNERVSPWNWIANPELFAHLEPDAVKGTFMGQLTKPSARQSLEFIAATDQAGSEKLVAIYGVI